MMKLTNKDFCNKNKVIHNINNFLTLDKHKWQKKKKINKMK